MLNINVKFFKLYIKYLEQILVKIIVSFLKTLYWF